MYGKVDTEGPEGRLNGRYRIDPGAVSLVAELRAHERQAAEELEPWKTGVEERPPTGDRGWMA